MVEEEFSTCWKKMNVIDTKTNKHQWEEDVLGKSKCVLSSKNFDPGLEQRKYFTRENELHRIIFKENIISLLCLDKLSSDDESFFSSELFTLGEVRLTIFSCDI